MKRITVILFLTTILLSACTTAPAANGAIDFIDTGVDPDTWALIPAGPFLSGLHNHETMIEYDYEAMVTTVTNQQYAEYLNQALADGYIEQTDEGIFGYYPGDVFTGFKHEEEIASGLWIHVPLDDPGVRITLENGQFTAIPGYENHPMVLVSWFGASAYCEYYNWRLPTELEWEKAARGQDGRAYPWGDEIDSANANFYSSHDIFERTFGAQGDTTPVGYFNGTTYGDFETVDSASPYGLYDMAGNVWQWTADIYENQHYRYMRGGSKADYAYNLRIWSRNNAGPDYLSPSTGFRCVRDILP